MGVSSGSVETTIADSDADQMVIPGADVRMRVYSPGIDDETATVRLRRVVTIMTLSVGLRL